MAEKQAKTVETQEHIPGKEHGGGFPPFQKDTFASQFLWLALTFLALYLLMSPIPLARIAAAEKDIRAKQAAAMTNVHGIAADAASAILERLIGRAPAGSEIEAAVADALKR